MWGGSGEELAEASEGRVEPVVSLISTPVKQSRGESPENNNVIQVAAEKMQRTRSQVCHWYTTGQQRKSIQSG